MFLTGISLYVVVTAVVAVSFAVHISLFVVVTVVPAFVFAVPTFES